MGKAQKTSKGFYIAGMIIIILLLVLVLFLMIDLRRSATLELLVTPVSAEVIIDGKKYENGTYKFEPGELNVIIKKEGFKEQEKIVTRAENTITKLYAYLMPLDGSFDWYLTHEEDMMILNAIGDSAANENSRTYLERYPIIDVLPIIYANYDESWDYTEFRVDGGTFENCKQEFCLKVKDTTGGNLEKALSLIRENGFTPEDYEIIYEYDPIEPLD